MQLSAATPMLFVGTLMIAAGFAAVTPAGAATPQLSDVAYMNAARCTGLAEGMGRDATGLKALVKVQGASREGFVSDRADQARADAQREARRAGPDTLRHLVAEADGACARYTAGATVATR